MKGQMMHATEASTLADILERVLDKGIVIAGDIKVSIADIELISIQIRLVICSVDKAQEIGINWWKQDNFLSSDAHQKALEKQNLELLQRIELLEKKLGQ